MKKIIMFLLICCMIFPSSLSITEIYTMKKDFVFYYIGRNDFEKVSLVKDVIFANGNKILIIKSCNDDLSGELSLEERVYEERVEISEDSLILNGNTVLRAPLFKDKEWKGVYTFYNGKSGLATFKIVKLDSDFISVKIIGENKLIEQLSFGKNKGLIKFEDNSFDSKKLTERYLLESTFLEPIDKNLWYYPPYLF